MESCSVLYGNLYILLLLLLFWPCNMWDLIPQPRIEPALPALEAQSPDHWMTKEVPFSFLLLNRF